jgi:pyrroline-5-carboxylate reductase
MTRMTFAHLTPENPLLLVGAGNMGRAMLSGWLAAGLNPAAIHIVDVAGGEISGIKVHGEMPQQLNPRVIVLAVKPQIIDALLPALMPVVHENTLVISIIAGKTIALFQNALGGHSAIIRAMPNLPAIIGKGITAFYGDADISTADIEFTTTLLRSVGSVVQLEKESQINAVTALSGSGPAYVFYFIECLISAGEQLGLSSDIARHLALETLIGAGALAAQPETDIGLLRQNVTSPGGTTQAALDVLMGADGLAALMRHALEAAAKRAKELGG